MELFFYQFNLQATEPLICISFNVISTAFESSLYRNDFSLNPVSRPNAPLSDLLFIRPIFQSNQIYLLRFSESLREILLFSYTCDFVGINFLAFYKVARKIEFGFRINYLNSVLTCFNCMKTNLHSKYFNCMKKKKIPIPNIVFVRFFWEYYFEDEMTRNWVEAVEENARNNNELLEINQC